VLYACHQMTCWLTVHTAFVTGTLAGCKVVQSLYLYVCLTVCLLAYLKNDISKIHKIFCTCYLWPWLDPVVMTVQYVITSSFVDDIMFSHIMGRVARGIGSFNLGTVLQHTVIDLQHICWGYHTVCLCCHIQWQQVVQ